MNKQKETKRYISAVLGILLLCLVIFFIDTILLNIVLSIIGILAVYEAVISSCKRVCYIYLILCSIFVVLGLFIQIDLTLEIILLLFLMFTTTMFSKKEHHFKDMSAVFLLTILISFGLSSLVKLRNLSSNIADMRVIVLFGLGYGWLGDSMAYTFGKAFGKKKLCPKISPNKTILGAVCGVTITTIVSVILFFIYSTYCSNESIFYGKNTLGNLMVMVVVGLVGSVIGVVGDLALSYVKREAGVKDFSNIMPGHGGALDRMDNIFFTSAYTYFIFSLLLK